MRNFARTLSFLVVHVIGGRQYPCKVVKRLNFFGSLKEYEVLDAQASAPVGVAPHEVLAQDNEQY